jgi:hypothetical protein
VLSRPRRPRRKDGFDGSHTATRVDPGLREELEKMKLKDGKLTQDELKAVVGT